MHALVLISESTTTNYLMQQVEIIFLNAHLDNLASKRLYTAVADVALFESSSCLSSSIESLTCNATKFKLN